MKFPEKESTPAELNQLQCDVFVQVGRIIKNVKNNTAEEAQWNQAATEEIVDRLIKPENATSTCVQNQIVFGVLEQSSGCIAADRWEQLWQSWKTFRKQWKDHQHLYIRTDLAVQREHKARQNNKSVRTIPMRRYKQLVGLSTTDAYPKPEMYARMLLLNLALCGYSSELDSAGFQDELQIKYIVLAGQLFGPVTIII